MICVIMSKRTNKPLRRPCKYCEKYFSPTTRNCYVCDSCKIKNHLKRYPNLVKRYSNYGLSKV